VGGAVRDAVDGAVDGAVGDAVGGAVRGAVRDAVDGAVDGAVRDAVDGAVDGAVGDAVRDAVGGAVRDAGRAIGASWYRIIGGQFWAGYWYWGSPAAVSFFQEVCGLELPGDMGARARAYQATTESACWWWPHRRFVMVSERPLEIHRELANPDQPRGWGSHRLHRDDGPAVVWPDGWGVWSVHGTRVPQKVVEAPESLTAEEITGERNAEVRRVMLERYGADRYLQEAGAELVAQDDFGKLWKVAFEDDEDLAMVEVVNSSPEPDGSYKTYFLRVPPRYRTAQGAIAWTFETEKNTYAPAVET
jgi:hypothetical protein